MNRGQRASTVTSTVNRSVTLNRAIMVTFTMLMILSGTPGLPALCDTCYGQSESTEYYTLLDENSQIVMRTSEVLDVGDEYVTSDNRRFRVTRVEGRTAHASVVEQVDLNKLIGAAGLVSSVVNAESRPIAVYHTHSSESYIPSDGTDSIPNRGGVYDVGAAFVKRIRELGGQAVQSTVSHDPYDDAYDRSRNTAIRLLQKSRPISVFDIHRDAVPAEEYLVESDVAAVQIIVGRATPQTSANEEFAYQIKQVVDSKEPGLIKGILIKRGFDYNQDLAPRLLLLEMGTYTNSKEAAEAGAARFAELAFPVIYGTSKPGAKQAATSRERSQVLRAALVIVALLIAAWIGFIALNSGSWSDFLRHLRSFGLTAIRGRNRLANRPDDSDED